ncbi:MAG: anti-sigma factor family protein [Gemmatimonadales bacterium]
MTCDDCDALLDALLDGDLAPEDRAAVGAHLAGCPACAASLREFERIREVARRAPREVPPPPGTWETIAARLRPSTLELRPSSGRDAPRLTSHVSRLTPWSLAAAAVLLVALSSAATAWLMGGRSGPPDRPTSRPPAEASLPPDLRKLEAEYELAALELARALERRRDDLSPGTVAALTRSVAVIDQAIAESRAAVLEAPGDPELGTVLRAAHEKKLELLERAARLLAES